MKITLSLKVILSLKLQYEAILFDMSSKARANSYTATRHRILFEDIVAS